MSKDKEKSWIGVDLDGTLAHYDGWKGIEHIGEPIMPMVYRIQDMLERRETIKIFTARASNGPEATPPIHAWLEKHGLPRLEVTNIKDYFMTALWDDRCVQVATNTGIPIMIQRGREITRLFDTDTQHVIVLCGLPRSGKSTWAKLFCLDRPNTVHINADAMRIAVYGERFNPTMEPMVHGAVHAMVRHSLELGYNVVIDECNTTPISRKRWEPWKTGYSHDVKYVIFDVPKVECIRRAIACGHLDLPVVIERMAAKWDISDIDRNGILEVVQ